MKPLSEREQAALKRYNELKVKAEEWVNGADIPPLTQAEEREFVMLEVELGL